MPNQKDIDIFKNKTGHWPDDSTEPTPEKSTGIIGDRIWIGKPDLSICNPVLVCPVPSVDNIEVTDTGVHLTVPSSKPPIIVKLPSDKEICKELVKALKEYIGE